MRLLSTIVLVLVAPVLFLLFVGLFTSEAASSLEVGFVIACWVVGLFWVTSRRRTNRG